MLIDILHSCASYTPVGAPLLPRRCTVTLPTSAIVLMSKGIPLPCGTALVVVAATVGVVNDTCVVAWLRIVTLVATDSEGEDVALDDDDDDDDDDDAESGDGSATLSTAATVEVVSV